MVVSSESFPGNVPGKIDGKFPRGKEGRSAGGEGAARPGRCTGGWSSPRRLGYGCNGPGGTGRTPPVIVTQEGALGPRRKDPVSGGLPYRAAIPRDPSLRS